MSIPVSEIENLLRKAPARKAPRGFRERLAADIRLSMTDRQTPTAAPRLRSAPHSPGWFRRWWPALAPTAVSLAGAVVLTMQQMEMHDLKQSIQALPQVPTTVKGI